MWPPNSNRWLFLFAGLTLTAFVAFAIAVSIFKAYCC
jgi:hypothetical protein